MSSTNTENQILSTTYNSHRTIIKLLPSYLNNDLNISENKKIENHLNNCFICQGEISRLQHLTNLAEEGSRSAINSATILEHVGYPLKAGQLLKTEGYE